MIQMDVDQQSVDSESTTESRQTRRARRQPRKNSSSSKASQGQQLPQLSKSKGTTRKRNSNKSKNINGHTQQQQQAHRIVGAPLTTVGGNNKRGCATRKEQQTATMASATGEVEPQPVKLKSSRNAAAAVAVADDPGKQRRTRRCLYKTEADVENNYATNNNMQNDAYSVWQYDDENSYGKGRNVNSSSRHCRK